MDHLVVGEGEHIVLGEGVGQAEGQLAVVVLAIDYEAYQPLAIAAALLLLLEMLLRITVFRKLP